MNGETLFALLCWTGIAFIGLCWWFNPRLVAVPCSRDAAGLRRHFPKGQALIRLRFILAPLLLIALALWARSYWRYDALAAGGWTVGSESGAVYLFRAVEPG